MERKEIKELAKTKIKGNKWNIIWPMLVIGALESVFTNLFGGSNKYIFSDFDTMTNVRFYVDYASILVSIIVGIISAGYLKYILNFVRNGKFDANEIIETIKKKWLNLLIAEILVTVIVSLCTLLFVVPGIIMGLAYAFVAYLVVDTDISGNDALKKGREMMKGYKWNYFVFGLSFIGWCLLIPLTLGIILIWLYPYMVVANAIYYDKLSKISDVK